MPDTGYLVLQLLVELTTSTLWNMFLTSSSVSKTEAMKNILTVLLRMYTHWSSQVTVIFKYNLSSLTSMYGDNKEIAGQIPPSLEANSTNETLEGEAAEEGLAWPSWQKEIMESIMNMQNVIPSIGSTQEVLECLIDLHVDDPSGAAQKYWKLVAPAVYWFFYPLLCIFWVIGFGWIFSRIIVRAYMVSTGEKTFLNAIGLSRSMEKSVSRIVSRAPKKEKQANGEEGDDSDASSSDSVFSSEGSHKGTQNKNASMEKTSDDAPSMRSWSDFSNVMNTLTVLPNRFSRRKKQRSKKSEAIKASMMTDTGDTNEARLLVFFRKDTSFRDMVDDVMPWLVVTFNNVWVPVTNRLLQMLYCETFPLKHVRLMMSTEVECWTSEVHYVISIIGIMGLVIWSVGIVTALFVYIRMKEKAGELQDPTLQYQFGYLLEGYEPRTWHWELLMKKMDLLMTAIITYTSLAPDTRAKVLLYAVLASMAITMQISYTPYDNRAINLLDHVENAGLAARFCVFWGVAICLLFDFTKIQTMIVAGLVMSFSLFFMFQLFVYATDDWCTTQYNGNHIKLVLRKKEVAKKAKKDAKLPAVAKAKSAKTKGAQKASKAAEAPSNGKPSKAPKDKVAMALDAWLSTLKQVRRGIFKSDYRVKQLVRFNWCGPTSDAAMVTPPALEGWIDETDEAAASEGSKFIAESKGKMVKYVFGLDLAAQNAFAVDCIEQFAYMLLVSANFEQLPARMTDLMMLLASSIKSLRDDLLNDPNPKVKKKKKPVAGQAGENQKEQIAAPPWAAISAYVSKDGRKGQLVSVRPWRVKWEDNGVIEEVKKWKGMQPRKPPAKAVAAEGADAEGEGATAAANPELIGDIADAQDEEDDNIQERGQMQQLKTWILRDIFERNARESGKRRRLLEDLRPILKPMLKERMVPEELAWEVLDRMTSAQLNATRVNPAGVLLRIRFFVHLMQCDADSEAALERIKEFHKIEVRERANVMKFLEFTLRSGMENKSMHWDEAAEILRTLPVEELRHLANENELCFEMFEQVGKFIANKKELHADVDAVNVEDLNNMLMFLQKFTYDELQEVLEYSQMLLDFLTLPSSEVWGGKKKEQRIEEADAIPDPPYKVELKNFEDSINRDPCDDISDLDMLEDLNDKWDQTPSTGSGGAEGMQNQSSSSSTRGSRDVVLRGRYVNGNGNGKSKLLPTLAEEGDSRRRHRGRDPQRKGQSEPERRAHGRIPTSTVGHGVGLASGSVRAAGVGGSQPSSRGGSDGEGEWDDDDDDPTVSDIGLDLEDMALEIGDAEIDDRNSGSWQSLQLDGFDNDAMSVGGRSDSALSRISELTGFSSVLGGEIFGGRRNARAEELLQSPVGSTARVAPVDLRSQSPSPPDSTSSSRRKDSASSSRSQPRSSDLQQPASNAPRGSRPRNADDPTNRHRRAPAAAHDRRHGKPSPEHSLGSSNRSTIYSSDRSRQQDSKESKDRQNSSSSSANRSGSVPDEGKARELSKKSEIARMRELLGED